MNDTSPREPALFTIAERCGVVIATMVIFVTTSVLFAAFPESNIYARKPNIVSRVFDSVHRWFGFAEEWGFTCLCITLLVIAVGVFCGARRAPQKVAAGMTCVAGVNLLIACTLIPFQPTDSIRLVLAGPDLTAVYHSGLEVMMFCLLQAMGLLSVCIAGEFYFLARERVMSEEVRIAEEEGEDFGRHASRRQQLLLAVMGPRTPISLPLARALTLVVIAPSAFFAITVIVFSISAESSLPAPAIQIGPSEQRPQIEFRLTEEGKIFHTTGTERLEPLEVEGLLRIVASEPPPTRQIRLRVANDAKYEHLIEIVSAAYSAGVRVVLVD